MTRLGLRANVTRMDPKEEIAMLKVIREERAERVRAAERELRLLHEELAGAEAVIRGRLRDHGMVDDEVAVDEIGKFEAHVDALKLIARSNGGILVVRHAKKLFLEAGRVKALRDASGTIYMAIKNANTKRAREGRAPEWAKVIAGQFRLLDSEDDPDNILTMPSKAV